MSNPKAHHYAKQLEAALCRGAWLESNPAKDYKGNPMDWAEMFRKFKKHCSGQDGKHLWPVTSISRVLWDCFSFRDDCFPDADSSNTVASASEDSVG
jgi:hypothetical protein